MEPLYGFSSLHAFKRKFKPCTQSLSAQLFPIPPPPSGWPSSPTFPRSSGADARARCLGGGLAKRAARGSVTAILLRYRTPGCATFTLPGACRGSQPSSNHGKKGQAASLVLSPQFFAPWRSWPLWRSSPRSRGILLPRLTPALPASRTAMARRNRRQSWFPRCSSLRLEDWFSTASASSRPAETFGRPSLRPHCWARRRPRVRRTKPRAPAHRGIRTRRHLRARRRRDAHGHVDNPRAGSPSPCTSSSPAPRQAIGKTQGVIEPSTATRRCRRHLQNLSIQEDLDNAIDAGIIPPSIVVAPSLNVDENESTIARTLATPRGLHVDRARGSSDDRHNFPGFLRPQRGCPGFPRAHTPWTAPGYA